MLSLKYKFIVLVLLFSGASQVKSQVNNYVTVGTAGLCDYTSIQDAINDSNNYFFIRVVTGLEGNRIEYNENLYIDREISLQGGYVTCADAEAQDLFLNSPKVYLLGTGTGPVITIGPGHDQVYIHSFEISGGNGTLGGGIQSGDSRLNITHSLIHSNYSSTKGGGIFLGENQPNSYLSLVDTKIIANQAVQAGGGIYCKNPGTIIMDENSGVSFNQASGSNADGGGIYADNCDIYIVGGTDQEANPISLQSYRGISYNSATRHGGGIYAIGSTVKMTGTISDDGLSIMPANLNNNTADSDNNNDGSGGGIYAVGGFFPFEIGIHRGKVQNNTAHIGGAFYIGSNLTFKMDRKISVGDEACWSDECSVLTKNTAKFKGGAIYIENGANALIAQTHITDNRSDYGTVLYVNSTGSSNTINLEQNFIYHNGRDGTGGFEDFNVIDMYNNSNIGSSNNLSLTIMHNTISDNHATQEVFALNGVNTYFGVFSSILHDPTSTKIAGLYGGVTNLAEFDCVNINETVSIGGSYSTLTRMNAGDPEFRIRNYDYHIKVHSDMQDYCDDSRIGSMVTNNDIDGDTRAVDDVTFQDFYGAWDLGADENINQVGAILDVIYKDSFDW